MDTPFSHKAVGEGGRGLRAAGRKRQERTFSHNVDCGNTVAQAPESLDIAQLI
jgi:hypothetical protein